MVAATLLTGVAAGLAGAGLTLLLHAVQHLAFGYTENTFLIGVEHAAAWRRVTALTAAGVVVGPLWWLQHRRVGVESVSVTAALRADDSRLPLLSATTDAGLQVVAVGAGASLGREGAPRQVGAALGRWLADRVRVTPAQRRTLLACGAGAGLASVYNVPLAGAAFVLEILLASVALADVVPALVTSGVATVVAWPFLGSAATYSVVGFRLTGPLVAWAAVMGPIAALAGIAFVRLMKFARTHAPAGVLSVPTIIVAFTLAGATAIACPSVLGNGKGPADLAFTGAMSFSLAAALTVLKPLVTAVCLGSGAIGGLLTPALATGASLGVLTGRLWDQVWSGTPVVDFAVVGAAAVLAVTQRAPITAIVLTLELLQDGLNLLGPIILAVGLATGLAWLIDHRMRPIALDLHRSRTSTTPKGQPT